MNETTTDKGRIDGKAGWKKGPCAWSKHTNYAWYRIDEKSGDYRCTCEPCLPPEKEERKVAFR